MLSGGQVPLTDIRPRQYQRPLGDLSDLITSIRTHGMIVPIIVDAGYEVIDGERRLAAAQGLGWRTIPCIANGNYDTIVEQLKETVRITRERELPHLPMSPRYVYEFLENVDRLYPYRIKPSGRPPLDMRRMSHRVKEDVSEIVDLEWSKIRVYRSIFSMEHRARYQWPDKAARVREIVHHWEAEADPTVTGYGIRTRIYETVNPNPVTRKRSSQRGLTSREDRPPRPPRTVRPKPVPEPPPEDTPALGQEQQRRIEVALNTIAGMASSLGAMALSQHIEPEQYREWVEQYAQASVGWHRFGKGLRVAAKRGNENQP